MKKVLFFILSAMTCFSLAGCKDKDSDKNKKYVRDNEWLTPGQLIHKIETDDVDDKKQMKNVEMVFNFRDDNDVEYYGYMQFVLFSEIAPKTVTNFIELVDDGFYDGLTITRVLQDTFIQGGDGDVTTTGKKKGDVSRIEGEFANNKCKTNVLSHRRGVISMARANDFNSAASQFFIVSNNYTAGDGAYAAFGWLNPYSDDVRSKTRTEDNVKIVYDYDCLDLIANLTLENEVGEGAPATTVKIVSAKVID